MNEVFGKQIFLNGVIYKNIGEGSGGNGNVRGAFAEFTEIPQQLIDASRRIIRFRRIDGCIVAFIIDDEYRQIFAEFWTIQPFIELR